MISDDICMLQIQVMASPNILEGVIELDDVGVVHHLHDGNHLISDPFLFAPRMTTVLRSNLISG